MNLVQMFDETARLRARVKELEASLLERLEVVEERNRLQREVETFKAGMLALLGPQDDYLIEYECEHGTPLGLPCFEDCHLNPTRRALGIMETLPNDFGA